MENQEFLKHYASLFFALHNAINRDSIRDAHEIVSIILEQRNNYSECMTSLSEDEKEAVKSTFRLETADKLWLIRNMEPAVLGGFFNHKGLSVLFNACAANTDCSYENLAAIHRHFANRHEMGRNIKSDGIFIAMTTKLFEHALDHQPDHATELLSKLMEIAPNDLAHLRTYWGHLVKNHEWEALKQEIGPHIKTGRPCCADPYSLSTYGWALIELGDTTNALSHYEMHMAEGGALFGNPHARRQYAELLKRASTTQSAPRPSLRGGGPAGI
jgi:hypothetical protein